MFRFLLIFFALAGMLFAVLVVQCERRKDLFATNSRPALSPEQNGVFTPNDRVGLTITPQPLRAMQPLYFQVNLRDDGEPGSVMIDLSMPDMYMGLNQITMKKSIPGVYKGTGIIPICPTGLKLWQASVIIDNQVAGNFFFDVQY
jgi:hypothetical protein